MKTNSTGYKDKNGVEILEGQAVRREDRLYKVVWKYFEDCCMVGEIYQLEPYDHSEELYIPSVYNYKEDLEVVHEN